MPEEEIWEVVGGVDTRGLIVRTGPERGSPQHPDRLACGALVKTLELKGERLHFQLVAGTGPDSGWVLKKLTDGRELLAKASKERTTRLLQEPVAPAASREPVAPDSFKPGGMEVAAKTQEECGRPGPHEGPANQKATATAPAPALPAASMGPAAGALAQPRATVTQVTSTEDMPYWVITSTPVLPPSKHHPGPHPGAAACSKDALGTLQVGDLVAVKQSKDGWFRLADWEVFAGWVPPTEKGAVVLEPTPGVPLPLLRLRAQVARTGRYLSRSLAANKPWAPLPRDPTCLGNPATRSVHNPIWGIEARCLMNSEAYAPPGRSWRVFAARPFASGEEVERCEVLVAKPGLANQSTRSVALRGRVWTLVGRNEEVLSMGFGSLYRQMDSPELANAEILATGGQSAPQLVLRATRPVHGGEELTVYLNKDHLGRPHLPPPECTRKKYEAHEPAHLLPPGGRASMGAVYPGHSHIHGLGVFAGRSFERGEIVELCPFLLLDRPALNVNAFSEFRMSFDIGFPPCRTMAAREAAIKASSGEIAEDSIWWPPVGDMRPPRVSGIALGSGALYNHAARPQDHNLLWTLHPGMGAVVMQAIKFIRKDTEICIDYGGTYWEGRNLKPQ